MVSMEHTTQLQVKVPEKGSNDTQKNENFAFHPIFTKFEGNVVIHTSYKVPRETFRKGSNHTRYPEIFVFQPIFTKFELHVANHTSSKDPWRISRKGVE
jgi:hypothetical protein